MLHNKKDVLVHYGHAADFEKRDPGINLDWRKLVLKRVVVKTNRAA